MFKRHLARMAPGRYIAVAAVLLVALAAIVLLLSDDGPPDVATLGLDIPDQVRLRLIEDGPGLPQGGITDAEGYQAVLDNGRYRLWLEPTTSRIEVEELASGKRWRSNPSESDLIGEKVKGILLTNLQSPFYFEFTKVGKTQRDITNTMDAGPTIDYAVKGGTLQATYTFDKFGIKLSLQYTLTEHGLVAAIPSEGIVEAGDRRMLSLNLLPFFGAAPEDAKDGYQFVPDGPGGLIYFDRERTIGGDKNYIQPVYGMEISNYIFSEAQREPIGYPVFGMKEGGQAFAAIIAQGEMTALIKAQPAGGVSSFHSSNAEFVYRQEYSKRLSRLSAPVTLIQEERIKQDRVVEYRLLTGQNADYVGMANAYRDYLTETNQLTKRLDPVGDIPLELTLLGGNARKTTLSTDYIPTTTFEQANEIVTRLVEDGVGQLRVTYDGWRSNGELNTGERFAVEKKLGGADGLERLAGQLKMLGVDTFRLDANLLWTANSRTGELARSGGVRGIDGSVYNDSGSFMLTPLQGVPLAVQWWEAMRKLGVTGVSFSRFGQTVYRDYNEDKPLEREDTAGLYGGLFRKLGGDQANVAAQRANAYALAGVDYIGSLTLDSNHDFIVDETVPFFPMVIHGYVTYSGRPGNLRDLYKEEQLKAVEYGAIPSFLITYDSPRLLKDTWTEGLYSSEFKMWEQRIKEEVALFQQLAPVLHQQMVGHKRVRDDVYATTYEDGTVVEVDYRSGTFRVKGGTAQ